MQVLYPDDSIAIKSGKNPEGNIINRPCEHIRIFDCVSVFGHGIAIGSEMSGGVRDVKIWDCDLANTRYGVEIKGTKKRGSFVRDIHVENCTVSRVLFHAVGYNDDALVQSTRLYLKIASLRIYTFWENIQSMMILK